MNISIEFNDKEYKLINEYAESKGKSISDLIREVILGKIEDAYDLKSYEESMKEYKENPKTYSIEEVKEIID